MGDAPKLLEALCAVYTRAIAATEITDLVPAANITNHREQDLTKYPAIVLKVESSAQWDTKDSDGYDLRYTFDIWTSEHGDKQVLEIMDAIHTTFHNVPFTNSGPSPEVTTGQSILLQCRESRVLEPDGVSHHGIIMFTHLFSK